MRYSFLLPGLVACVLVGCGSKAERVTVSAAASTREALEWAKASFHSKTGVIAEMNFGPSSTLAEQIAEGGGADVYLSADEAWADYLDKKGLVEKRRDLLSNNLVVVLPAESTLTLSSLSDLVTPAVRRLALAGPSVPAGRYATEALTAAGIWDQVKERVLRAQDVRAALVYVEKDEAEAGLVYATDARLSNEVRVALKVPPELHSPIRYPLVLIRRPTIRPQARQLYDYLCTEAAGDFRKAGFDVVP